jgi:hypothetical protein
VYVAEPVTQPTLPDLQIDGDGELTAYSWPQATLDWWQSWIDEPISADFRATDWSFLLDTALLHAAVWRGELKYLGELRLRVAKLGATVEDRARLRITFAKAEEAEGKRPGPRGGSARDRYQGPRAIEE